MSGQAEPKAKRGWLPASLVAHTALVLAVLFCHSSNQPSPQVVWISEITTEPSRAISPGPENGPVVSQAKLALTPPREDIRTLVSANSVQGPDSDSALSGDNSGGIASDQVARKSGRLATTSETVSLNTTRVSDAEGIASFAEEPRGDLPGLTVTRYKDWQFGSFEDNKLTYAAPGSAIKWTVRESLSAGFGAQNFIRPAGVTVRDTSGPFGLTPADLSADAIARSYRVDWALFNSKSFGLTAFGYQSEVGRGFEPLGQTKTEFGKAGKNTMKAGGQVRIGSFGFGLAQSSIANIDNSAETYFASTTTDSTVQQEASATVNLAQLLPGGVAPKLLPVLWMSASTSQSPTSGQASETVTTSFGGTWTWNMGYASLGYWNYSSGKNAGLGATWRGHGFDANLGAYRSSFGLDVGLSYGQSEDVAPSWQSAGAIYNSYATVSYKPGKLPGVSLTAAAGNYDHNALSYGGSLSDPYAMTSNGEYLSLTAGLDLTGLFWSAGEPGAANEQGASVKMFYRYSDSLFLADSTNATKDVDSLVAMSIQRKF